MGQRSTSRSIDGGDDSVVVGQIRGPHGTRGEVRLDPRTDVEGRFAPGVTFDCEGIGPLEIAELRGPAGQPIVKFAGYDTREQAFLLRDRFLRVPLAEARRAVGAGAFLWRDLIGLAVQTPEGTGLGTVRELLRAGATDVLVVVTESGKELLLPMIDTVIRAVEPDAGRIVAVPQEEL